MGRTSACKLAAYYQNTFSKQQLWVAASGIHAISGLNEKGSFPFEGFFAQRIAVDKSH